MLWFIGQGQQDPNVIAKAVKQPTASVENVFRNHWDVGSRIESGHRVYFIIEEAA